MKTYMYKSRRGMLQFNCLGTSWVFNFITEICVYLYYYPFKILVLVNTRSENGGKIKMATKLTTQTNNLQSF